MAQPSVKQLLEAGVHFGHLKRKWNPSMAPYIFMEKNGIHIIDLNKTAVKLDDACKAVRQMARSGKKVLFVATKKQAQEIIAREAKRVNMPYVTERWPGGMLTNFATIRKAIRKMGNIDKMATDGTFETMNKKERLMIMRQREKLERNLGSISDLGRLPSAIFVVDIVKEHIAVAEAKRLNIQTFAIVDTNADPKAVDFAIPGNDDATASIEIITRALTDAIIEGLNDRKNGKGEEGDETDMLPEEEEEVVAAEDGDEAEGEVSTEIQA